MILFLCRLDLLVEENINVTETDMAESICKSIPLICRITRQCYLYHLLIRIVAEYFIYEQRNQDRNQLNPEFLAI